jgi:hypothetical protein
LIQTRDAIDTHGLLLALLSGADDMPALDVSLPSKFSTIVASAEESFG